MEHVTELLRLTIEAGILCVLFAILMELKRAATSIRETWWSYLDEPVREAYFFCQSRRTY